MFGLLESGGTFPVEKVGSSKNFWTFSQGAGYDLTQNTDKRSSSSSSSTTRHRLKLNTVTAPVTIDPDKTALIIVDMQNYFLSPALGRQKGPGHDAENVLINIGIPAARKAKIQIVHVTWGISNEELDSIPPVLWRAFGFNIAPTAAEHERIGNTPTKEQRRQRKLGEEMGRVILPDGTTLQAGRMLMRDQWNTQLHQPLQKTFEESQKLPLPDVQVHKNRISGFWGGSTPALKFLEEKGIRTLLFSGVNTDQCVLSSLMDACNMGFTTFLLRDACGTTSPEFSRLMVEWNCRRTWGFVSSCEALKEGVETMI